MIRKSKSWICALLAGVMVLTSANVPVYATEATENGVEMKMAEVDLDVVENADVTDVTADLTQTLPVYGAEYSAYVDGVIYSYQILEDGTVEILGCSVDDSEVEILNQIDGKDVTIIGEGAFRGCDSLKSIIIPSSVTSIEEGAFSECDSLESITLPSSVTNIGDEAFSECGSLKNITLPSNVTSIGKQVFYKCDSLKSVTIALGLKNIGEKAFAECKALESITLPSSVMSLGDEVFNGCSSLKSITLSSGITSIGERTFYDCWALESIALPSSLVSIGEDAFCHCSSLKSITLPSSVTNIGEGAFNDCGSLKSITIPSGVTSVGDYVLGSCSALTSITLPSSLESIGKYAFYECSSLTSIELPSSVTSIGEAAFYNCENLKSITLSSSLESIGEITFGGCNSLKSITLPSNLASIGEYAFTRCYSLTSITIPASVTSIEEGTFGDCKSLKSITLTSSVKNIGNGAFMGCPSLTIYGNKGSYAETYATKNKIPFSATKDSASETKPKAVTLSKVTSEKKGFKATWKKGTDITGYQLQYSTSSKFASGKTSNKNISKSSTTSVKISNLKATEQYYVRIRAYKKVDEKKVYSDWSDTMSVITKDSKGKVSPVKSVELSETSYTYNGKTQKPKVTVKDKAGNTLAEGTYYKLSYSKGCKKVGKYTVKVSFKGNYSGTKKKTLTYTINPKKVSISKLTAEKKGLTATWKKGTDITGYEIQYSTSSKFEKKKTDTVTVKNANTKSKEIKKLSANKKYYVRIRAYKTVKVDGKSTKIYSDWSKEKSVTTKK